MKIRSDFVSNSSSSSFIVAINGDYDIKSFSEDLAKACSNPDAEYHDPTLENKNKFTLEFCLNNFVAAYVGELHTYSKEHIHTQESYIEERMEFQDISKSDTLKHWNNELASIERCKDKTCSKEHLRQYKKNFFENGKLHLFYSDSVWNMPVAKEDMRYSFDRFGHDSDNAPETVKLRTEAIEKLAAEYVASSSHSRIDIFSINKDSIKNTRELIAAGVDIEVNEDLLTRIEKCLDAGDKVFSIRLACSGDGYGTYYIYQEDGAESAVDNIAMEVLSNEYM